MAAFLFMEIRWGGNFQKLEYQTTCDPYTSLVLARLLLQNADANSFYVDL